MYDLVCVICNNNFISKAPNKKTCSESCLIQHRKNKRKKREETEPKTIICKGCNKTFHRFRERGGFCSRSCASKHYYENGHFDEWHQKGMEINIEKRKTRIEINCQICNKIFYAKCGADIINKHKFCSKKCLYKHNSILFSGEGSHFYGKRFIWEEKRKKTLKERYNVTTAFALAKNRKTISKGQLDLYNNIKLLFLNEKILKEKMVLSNKMEYYADILIPKYKIVIEYNGDFWHCNPTKYNENYFNPKKQKLAKEIWEYDKIRTNNFKNDGYKVLIVWESDYKNNKKEVLSNLKKEIENIIHSFSIIDTNK